MATIKDLKRMCENSRCADCPFSDKGIECKVYSAPQQFPDDADKIVDKWVEEHPVKTYAMDFFEKFPNAQKDRNGAPMACWKHIYGDGNDCVGDCIKRWNQEMKEE